MSVCVADTKGSVPREVGTAMRVYADRITGTIGGGALEWQAMARARTMLAAREGAHRERVTLGPDAGQCCGGVVVLDYTLNGVKAAEKRRAVYLWGAGHVGRAIAGVLAPHGDFDVTLIDTSAERLPPPIAGTTPLVAADPLLLLPRLPRDATHFILTYSHALDLALCDGLLRHGFRACGLIGSKTKWARFRSRLQAMGHDDAAISRITCPIGDPSLGKHPQAIAVSVAHGLLSEATTTCGDNP